MPRDVELRLSSDESTGTYRLIVRYTSPPEPALSEREQKERHEEEHRKVLDSAYGILEKAGYRPDRLSHIRIECQTGEQVLTVDAVPNVVKQTES